jgi:hypothetical protein
VSSGVSLLLTRIFIGHRSGSDKTRKPAPLDLCNGLKTSDHLPCPLRICHTTQRVLSVRCRVDESLL